MKNATVYAKNGYPVKLRKQASAGSTTVVVTIPVGQKIKARHHSNGWEYVEWNSYKGYMKSEFVIYDDSTNSENPNPSNPGYPIEAIVDISKHGKANSNSVNIRSDYFISSGIVARVPNGAKVYIENRTGTWTGIKYNNIKGYIMNKFIKGTDAYNRNYTIEKHRGAYGDYYSTNNYLNNEQRQTNAKYIYNYFINKKWTKNAICGMLGNIEVESSINPGLWQKKKVDNDKEGFGLTQWTPAYKKILVYAYNRKKQIDDMDMQLSIIEEELNEELNEKFNEKHDQWKNELMPKTTFKSSTSKPDYLAEIFCKAYERPRKADYTTRKKNALRWFEYLK